MTAPARPPRLPVQLAHELADIPTIVRLAVSSIGARPPREFADGTGAPVVILRGVLETWGWMRAIASALSAAGHPVHTIPGLGVNVRPVAESAELVGAEIARLDLRGAVLVAHSKGGLIGKEVLRRHAGEGRIRGLVAVATPFSGSSHARFMPGRTLRAFHPAHPLIVDQVADRSVDDRIVSIAPRFDPHVPNGSRVEGAAFVEVPVVGHFRVMRYPAAVDAVVREVERLAT